LKILGKEFGWFSVARPVEEDSGWNPLDRKWIPFRTFVTDSGKRSRLSHGSDMCDDSFLVHSTVVDTKQVKLI
jgi:hypothetical protein